MAAIFYSFGTQSAQRYSNTDLKAGLPAAAVAVAVAVGAAVAVVAVGRAEVTTAAAAAAAVLLPLGRKVQLVVTGMPPPEAPGSSAVGVAGLDRCNCCSVPPWMNGPVSP